MKTIKTLLIIVTLIISTVSFAQSHNTTVGSTCKYAKNRCTNMEGCPQCAACNINDKKEKDAKAEEIKKRNEKIWADAKAKKDAEQKAYQDKLAADEVKRKAESGDVVINAQPNNILKPASPKKESKKNDHNPNIVRMYGFDTNDFFRIIDSEEQIHLGKGQKIRSNNIINGDYGLAFEFPPNTGIITIEKPGYCNGYRYSNDDLVDEKLNRLLKNDSIQYIEHFYGDWFFIGYWPCENNGDYNGYRFNKVKFYNTKQKIFMDLQIESSLFLKPQSTEYLYGKGRGTLVSHNDWYFKGFSDNPRNLPFGKLFRHYGYDLFYDKISGGEDKWKAAITLFIRRSKDENDYYYLIYLMNEKGEIKKYNVDKTEFKTYYYKK
jgi:hypothetical protein